MTADRTGVQLGYRIWGANPDMTLAGWAMRPAPFARWSHDSYTVASCECRSQLLTSLEPQRPPGDWMKGHKCGLYAHEDVASLSWDKGSDAFVAGAALTWGRIVHHGSFFRAEKALPVAFVEPAGEIIAEVVRKASESLRAVVLSSLQEVVGYAEEEAKKW